MNDAALVDRAHAIGTGLLAGSWSYAQVIQAHIRGDSELREDLDPDPPILFEAFFFTFHIVDRFVFQLAGRAKRDLFMDALLATVSDRANEVGLPQSFLQDGYNEKNFEYSRFKKLFPGKDDSLKDTLCWEFGRQIAQRYANGNFVVGTTIGLSAANHAVGLAKVLHEPATGVLA